MDAPTAAGIEITKAADGKGMLQPGVLMIFGLAAKDVLILLGKLMPDKFNTKKGSAIGLIFMIQLVLTSIVYYFYKRDKGEMELLTRPKEFIEKNKLGVAFSVGLALLIGALYSKQSPFYLKVDPSMKIKILASIVGIAGLYVGYKQYRKRYPSKPGSAEPGSTKPIL
tara:strand:- start:1229 stop:1732 length:504 start_codon:yes stop_codon:yes gene_type:complete